MQTEHWRYAGYRRIGTKSEDMKIEFAKSMSGHDRNQIYLIKEKDEKYVYLVNGVTKPLTVPKKKSFKHIQIIKTLPEEVLKCMCGELTDITVKKAIKTYQSMVNNHQNH